MTNVLSTLERSSFVEFVRLFRPEEYRPVDYRLIPTAVFSLPNQLTFARAGLAVVLFALIAYEQWVWCLVVFAVAAFTDWLDGYLARAHNLGTAVKEGAFKVELRKVYANPNGDATTKGSEVASNLVLVMQPEK